jgi:hypothetical protein
MKKYKAHPEFISRAAAPKLYELEAALIEAIRAVAEHRVTLFGESLYEEAIPQTLLTVLGSFDKRSAEVASKCYLSGVEEVIEVES